MQLYIVDCKEGLEPNCDENVVFAICTKYHLKPSNRIWNDKYT